MAKAKSSSKGKKIAHRSSISGKYVSEQYAKKHPKTTQKETR